MSSIVSSYIGGRPPLQLSLRVVRLDQRLQAPPRNHRIHLRQKLLAPCHLLSFFAFQMITKCKS